MFTFLLAMLPLTCDRRAVTALEYGLIAGVIVVVVLTGFNLIGNELSTKFDNIAADLT